MVPKLKFVVYQYKRQVICIMCNLLWLLWMCSLSQFSVCLETQIPKPIGISLHINMYEEPCQTV